MTDLRQMLAGKFIVLDGPDGAGKSSQLKLLAEHLQQRGVNLLATRDPGSTAIGNKIREILLDRANDEMSVACELMLYMASRAQLVAQVIRPALDRGCCVLCDRFVSATIAYQGAGGVDESAIRDVAQVAVEGLWPDLTVIVDLPPEIGMTRLGADRNKDRMEAKDMAFHARVRESFLAQAQANPTRFTVIDGRASLMEVQSRLRNAIENWKWIV